MDWSEQARKYREMIEPALELFLPPPIPGDPAGTVREAMRYSLLSGGKRLRPVLTLGFCTLCGGNPQTALPFACGVEMVHTYSLIHDDMPCMDDDDLRRGRPTNHKVYGEDVALLAGDGLLTKAFEVVLTHEDAALAVRAALVLSQCAGDRGMVGGQCVDLKTAGEDANLDLLRVMDLGKTVALISAACRMGCIAAGAGMEEEEAAQRYALGLGLAFQIRDDVLDVLGDADQLGKNVGVDSAKDKRNYVSLLGADRAQTLVEEYTANAVAALDAFPGDGPEESRDFLKNLALSLRDREN